MVAGGSDDMGECGPWGVMGAGGPSDGAVGSAVGTGCLFYRLPKMIEDASHWLVLGLAKQGGVCEVAMIRTWCIGGKWTW